MHLRGGGQRGAHAGVLHRLTILGFDFCVLDVVFVWLIILVSCRLIIISAWGFGNCSFRGGFYGYALNKK